jgi:RND family efflux transporter MFP subunit
MKKIIIISLTALTLVSCGGDEKKLNKIITSENLEEIRAFRVDIVAKQTEINSQLDLLDKRIAELDDTKKLPLITTYKIEADTFKHFIELQGNVNTKNLLIIYPEFTGILKEVLVSEGQTVSKGQVLAIIDDGGMAQQLAQQEVQLELAKTSFERQERLWKDKIGSEMQYLQAKTNYDATTKAVSQLREQLGKTVIKAPFSGIIDDVITEKGSLVSPGASQIIRIVNLDDMYIETMVSERYISDVTKGKNVEIQIPVIGKTIYTKIRQAGNFINPANRTFKVEVALPNEDRNLKPNLTAKLRVNDYTNEKALLIPQSIISENSEGEQYVYAITNKQNDIAIAKKVFITTGKTQGDVIEILEGLKNGDEIVNEGARSVKEGQEVKISK